MLVDVSKRTVADVAQLLLPFVLHVVILHGRWSYCVLGDGSCVCMKTSSLSGSAASAADEQAYTELTGSDCDPVYRAASDGRSLFTCCRDSVIRRYMLNSL